MKKNIAGLFLVFSMVFISCDQDFNTIGADLVGDEHFDFSKHEVGLKAYSVATNEVQTNNLPINPIGIYDNPYFGKTKSNFVTQLSLVTSQPKFGASIQVENVILHIPYFSTLNTTNADGSRVFTLDSIYSKTETGKTSKMKLSVYENGYVLNSFDSNTDFQMNQRYYSDGSSINGPIDFENLKIGADANGDSFPGGPRLNNSTNVKENDEFFFNKEEIVVYKTKFNTGTGQIEYVDANGVVLPLADQTDPTKWVVKERLSPGIYLTLNKEYFKKKILQTASNNLFNSNNFRQHFKGLYFKIEELVGETGAMAMLNFNNGKISVNYSSISDGATEATSKTFEIKLGTNSSGNTVSIQDFNYSGDYAAGLTASATNPVFGSDSNLYLKGGKGSVVYMDVFGDDLLKEDLTPGANGVPDELEAIRKKGWLINDAYLEFYVDKTKMAGNLKSQEPERLYLFDATNQKVLLDYTFDTSTSANSKRVKQIHGGIVERDNTPDRKAVKYKIRISQHINNLINSANENLNKNVKLGLCVTENVALTGNFYYKTPVAFPSGPNIEYFPVSSIMSQQGVVLHGTNPAPADAAKKLKLTIHYTKPN